MAAFQPGQPRWEEAAEPRERNSPYTRLQRQHDQDGAHQNRTLHASQGNQGPPPSLTATARDQKHSLAPGGVVPARGEAARKGGWFIPTQNLIANRRTKFPGAQSGGTRRASSSGPPHACAARAAGGRPTGRAAASPRPQAAVFGPRFEQAASPAQPPSIGPSVRATASAPPKTAV